MQPGEHLKVAEIVQPERVVVINLNYSEELFKAIFSKMEFTMAWDYLEEPLKKYSIPRLYTHRTGNHDTMNEFAKYLAQKQAIREEHTAPESPLDERFMERFKEFLPDNRDDVLDVPHEDIFLNSGVEEWIRKTGRDTVMFTGFFTERDVYFSAFEALMRGFYSVIVSDATSTYSERIFFTSLDLISQTVEVIDTRDLEKMW